MSDFNFLHTYPPAEAARLERLWSSSIDLLPSTLAIPLKKFTEHLATAEYDRATRYALSFFELYVQYLACLLITLIQKADLAANVTNPPAPRAIQKALQALDDKRPLSLGNWVDSLLLPLLQEANSAIPADPLFSGLKKGRLYQELTGKNPPKLAEIRNIYTHQISLSAQTTELYQKLLGEVVEPKLTALLDAATPLWEWSFFACRQVVEPKREYRVSPQKGWAPAGELLLKTNQPLEVFHYYFCQGELTATPPVCLDLFPLVWSDESEAIYVLHSLEKYEKVSYTASDGQPLTADRWNQALDARLQPTLKTFSVAKELNLAEIVAFADKSVRSFLDRAYQDKKYDSKRFVERPVYSAVFDAFRQSDRPLFPLLGEAGQGKTNQLCSWLETNSGANNLVAVFDSAAFAEVTLGTKLLETFGFGEKKTIDKQLTNLLGNLHKVLAAHGQKLYFFFDALNECLRYKGSESGGDDGADGPGARAEGPLELYAEIRKWLIDESYPCFKVLFTCRNYTWNNLIKPRVPPADLSLLFQGEEADDAVSIRGFTAAELTEAYAIYQQVYRIKTPLTALAKSCTIRLRDPLTLKMTCANYLGGELPDATLAYTSLALFEKMQRDLADSYAGNDKVLILKELALYLLAEYERGTSVASLTTRQLQEAFHRENSPLRPLATLVYNNDAATFSVAFRELTQDQENPVLRLEEQTPGEAHLRFIYERFLEFMLALVFVERERAAFPARTGIPAATFVEKLKPVAAKPEKSSQPAANVVFMGTLRNALLMDYTSTGDPAAVLTLISEHGALPEVMLLVSETLNVLIRENYETALFKLIERFLNRRDQAGAALIKAFNAVCKKIESNQGGEAVIKEYNQLYRQLLPVLRLRKMAAVSVVNGMFLTDYFNEDEGVYCANSFEILWRLLTDPLIDVRNDACHYVYYLANKEYTHERAPLKENLAYKIIHELFKFVNETSFWGFALEKQRREQTMIFTETAGRLSVLLIIDAMTAGGADGERQIDYLLQEFRAAIKHLSANHRLLKLSPPFLKIILRRQATFQAAYVNNIIEYQTFWDQRVIPLESTDEAQWSRACFREILVFIFHYNRYYKKPSGGGEGRAAPDFSRYHACILSAYQTGDSLSYFVLERIMVIMGVCDWAFIRPVLEAFFNDKSYAENPWFDYSQMSMLYVLYQVALHNPRARAAILPLYSEYSRAWTKRCKGLFRGRQSAVANPTGKYKRSVMTWYCLVYNAHSGDNLALPGDPRPVPVFYDLIDEAVLAQDKELLYHLLESISELLTEAGEQIKTALGLLKYIMSQLARPDQVDALDGVHLDRSGVYQDDLATAVGKVLSTAKNRYNTLVDDFIVQDLAGLNFPGISRYRGEILNYNPGEETLSDLFTHKFGNFLIWALLNEEAIEQCIYDALSESVTAPDCFKWFDQVVKVVARDVLKTKL